MIPALNAAFVNIGLGKDGFLSLHEMNYEQLQLSIRGRKSPTKTIESLRIGDPVLVQIAKEAIRDKGPALTGKISLPGRYLIYMPYAKAIRMSRMLSDAQKKQFHELVKKELDSEGGLIFRTAAKGRAPEDIKDDLDDLKKTWNKIIQDFEEEGGVKLLNKELDLFERVLRDNFFDHIEEIIIDHPRLKHRITQFLKNNIPEIDPEKVIKFHTDKTKSVWEAFNLIKDINRLFSNNIPLNCGGTIIIEEMETLTAIDVNSGKNIAGKRHEETILETNLEAAVEIARQLRLRQIGGIIVIDFIDMLHKRDRDRVFSVLESELEKDRTPSDIQEFTDLGLIQITRQRLGQSLTRRLTYTCPHCNGSGRRPSISLS